MALTLTGDGAVGPLSATEVGYLDGVTSAVQTQINSKLTTPGVWTSWTPSWSNLTIGNAYNYGRYIKIGSFVHATVEFTWGSTTSASSVFIPDIPTGASGSIAFTGNGWAFDASATVWNNITWSPGGYLIAANGNRVNQTVPWTWATGDIIRLSISYEAA